MAILTEASQHTTFFMFKASCARCPVGAISPTVNWRQAPGNCPEEGQGQSKVQDKRQDKT